MIWISVAVTMVAASGAPPPTHIEQPVEALAQDATDYAARHGVTLAEGMARLRAQEESVATTDALRALYRDRIAGVAIDHAPAFRIVILLTGTDPVPDTSIVAGGMTVPILFRTGAMATHEAMVAAIPRTRAAIRERFPFVRGLGVDQRAGAVVAMVRPDDAAAHDMAAVATDLATLTGVPVRIRVLGSIERDLAMAGGARVDGIDPADGRRYRCTTGFVVTDGVRSGIVTAAHCPDTLTYRDPEGGSRPLEFVGQWGARYQDVQVHIADPPLRPLFYVDTPKTMARMLTTWRNRASTRAGDTVCHRGETTGYSCAEVELVDYAPQADLCGGPCDATWVTVAGPNCAGGDSGGPIFSATTAFGIVKGGSYSRPGRCDFYYYMSTDYLPPGWKLAY